MTAEDYRAKADEARRQAEQPGNAPMRDQWLKLVQSWDALASSVEQRKKRGCP